MPIYLGLLLGGHLQDIQLAHISYPRVNIKKLYLGLNSQVKSSHHYLYSAFNSQYFVTSAEPQCLDSQYSPLNVWSHHDPIALARIQKS